MASMLFSPLTLRDLVIPNRIMVSPMGQYSSKNGSASDWHLMHYGTMSVSGAGLVMIEASAINPDGRLSPNDMGLWSDDNEVALARVIAFCRQHGGAHLGIQLWHSGRKGSVRVAWEHQARIPVEEGGWVPLGPSPLAYPKRTEPRPLDEGDMDQQIQDYVAATKRADRLGLDVLELHSAHGYLLHNFLSPLTNVRTDKYGGSLENRMRFPLQVFKAIRAAWPAHKPLGARISSVDFVDGGWGIEDSIAFVRELQKLGCDYVTASGGGSVPEQNIKVGPGYQVPYAEQIRRATGMVTVAVGLITEPTQAEDILSSGRADMVALGRRMLYNPRWPWHAAAEFGEEFFYPKQYERSHPAMLGGDFLRPSRVAQGWMTGSNESRKDINERT